MRTGIAKFFFLSRNVIAVDVGWRDIAFLIVRNTLLPLGAAIIRASATWPAIPWGTFGAVFGLLVAKDVLENVFHGLSATNTIFRRVQGQVWREERKLKTAAILKRLNVLLAHPPADTAAVRELLTDILGVVALHVRDDRGHTRDNAGAFATLLLVDGQDLVVVARDPKLTSVAKHRRPIPKRYDRVTCLAGRAIESRQVLSVGDLWEEYPEVREKPYRSVLAIPLIASDGKTVFGALSIDSPTPYSFQSFQPMATENRIENGLQPYAYTLTICVERLLSNRFSEMAKALESAEEIPTGQGGVRCQTPNQLQR